MLESIHSVQKKAFIACMYESGARPFGIPDHVRTVLPDVPDEQAKEFFSSDTCSKQTPYEI